MKRLSFDLQFSQLLPALLRVTCLQSVFPRTCFRSKDDWERGVFRRYQSTTSGDDMSPSQPSPALTQTYPLSDQASKFGSLRS
ncbi:hypothetical protein T484DRAFT_2431166 [Baffinella frigidus]|nr:hypothetical protein T484DRAFT_2431166 [Cryptophyta sp. CCMP2293]